MFFRKKEKEKVEEVVEEKEFCTYGLSDILHYIKREIGVDLFVKKNIIETRLRLFVKIEISIALKT